MIWVFFGIIVLFVYPFWLFVKLARYGQGVFRPNFERMKRKVDEWTGFSYDGLFAYNRPFGRLIYYLLLLYLFGFVFMIMYRLAF